MKVVTVDEETLWVDALPYSATAGNARGRLQIFIERGCRSCRHALELAVQAQNRFPSLPVEIVNLSDPGVERPDEVFAVPTYLLDGQVISLGNPAPQKLMDHLATYLALQAQKEGV